MIEADRVQLLAGETERVATPSASGKGQAIVRCARCRVALWSHYAGSGDAVSFVRVGTLDDPDRLPPDIHIFTMSKQPWVLLPPGTPAVAEYYRALRALAGGQRRAAQGLEGVAPSRCDTCAGAGLERARDLAVPARVEDRRPARWR